MKIHQNFYFNINYEDGSYKNYDEFFKRKKEIDHFLLNLGISDIPPDRKTDNPLILPRAWYDFYLDMESPEYGWLTTWLHRMGMKYHYHFRFEFSKEEVEQSPLFLFQHYLQRIRENKHPAYSGTKYKKEIVCPACGLIKWTQLNELHIDTSIMKKDLILMEYADLTGGGFVLVSETLARILETEGISGYELRPVIHVGSEHKRKKIYQLVSTSILPPLSKQMHLEPMPNEYCSVCGLYGRFPWPLHYDSSSLTDIKDINYMAEYLDYGICLQRYLVISARARNLFLKLNKTKKIRFEPVILIDN